MAKKKKHKPDQAPAVWTLPEPSAGDDGFPDVAKHLLDLYAALYEQDTDGAPRGRDWERYIEKATGTYKAYVAALVEKSPDLMDQDDIRRLDAIDARGLTDAAWPGGLLAEHMPYAESLDEPVFAFAPCFRKGLILLPQVNGTIPNNVQFEVLAIDGEAGAMSLRIRNYCEAPGRYEPGLGCDADIFVRKGAGGVIPVLKIHDRVGFTDLYTRLPPRELGWDRATARQWRKTVLQNAVDQAARFERAGIDPHLQLVQRFLSGCLAANAGLSSTKPVMQKDGKPSEKRPDEPASGKTPAGKPSGKAPPERLVRVAGLVRFSSARPPRPAEKAAREYRTPSWTARGHIRHYKNGKQVYIRPTVRHRKALSGRDGHVPSTVRIVDNRPKETED